MIEIIIDFKKCPTKEEDFILYLCDIFNIPRVCGWDAFRDNISGIFISEISSDYTYTPNDEWGWSSYKDYKIYLEEDRSIGIKGDSGYREDIKVIFINFYDFNYKNRYLAETLVKYMIEKYASIKNHKYTEEDELLKFNFYIES